MVLTLVLPRSAETEQARILGQDTLERSRRVLGPDRPGAALMLEQHPALDNLWAI
jgi:hypothetical protein